MLSSFRIEEDTNHMHQNNFSNKIQLMTITKDKIAMMILYQVSMSQTLSENKNQVRDK